MALLLATTLPFLSTVSAWGTLGHTTVAVIAQHLVDNSTATFAQQLLNDTSPNYLAHIATWADSYRKEPEGEFSSVLHYIDALDEPPKSCNLIYERDCPEEGCIVSAIANYTERVQATSNVSLVERQKALKWIVHFLGDIHQPLHVENLEIGGNLINVTFAGVKTNLHHIWDTEIPEKLIGGYALEDSERWASQLVSEIQTGKYAEESKTWLQGIDVEDSVESAMVWGRDANSYVCSTVIPEGGADAVRDQELEGDYYDDAVPVVEIQVAKAGFRLAAWLNLIVTGRKGLGCEDYGYGYPKSGLEKRRQTKRNFELESWMVDARRVRRAHGYGCNHEH